MPTKKQTIMIFTIGHSTHPLQEFIELLKQYDITHLVDIRTIPKSRHNPQFNETALKKALTHAHIKYTHVKELGGLRHAQKDSINTAWKNASFRGFADYMQTPEFTAGIEQLLEFAQHDQVAIMCAEAVPWRCHRSLIGDALLVHGITVQDIFSRTSVKPHTLTPWAQVQNTTITYPAETESKKN